MNQLDLIFIGATKGEPAKISRKSPFLCGFLVGWRGNLKFVVFSTTKMLFKLDWLIATNIGKLKRQSDFARLKALNRRLPVQNVNSHLALKLVNILEIKNTVDICGFYVKLPFKTIQCFAGELELTSDFLLRLPTRSR